MSGILQPWRQAQNNYRVETTSKVLRIFVVDVLEKFLKLTAIIILFLIGVWVTKTNASTAHMSGILQPWRQAQNNYRVETTSKVLRIFVVDDLEKILKLTAIIILFLIGVWVTKTNASTAHMSGILQPWRQAQNNYRVETTPDVLLIFVVDVLEKFLKQMAIIILFLIGVWVTKTNASTAHMSGILQPWRQAQNNYRVDFEKSSHLCCWCFRKILKLTAIIILFLIGVWVTKTNASTAHMSGILQPWRQAQNNYRVDFEKCSHLCCWCFRKILKLTAIIILFLIGVWVTKTNASTAHMSGILQPWRQAQNNYRVETTSGKSSSHLCCWCFRKIFKLTAIIMLFLIGVWVTKTNASTAHMSGILQPWRQAQNNYRVDFKNLLIFVVDVLEKSLN